MEQARQVQVAAAYTPGPWQFDGESRIDALQFRKPTQFVDENGVEQTYMLGLVALPYGCGGSGTHQANAHLIAAAPELLEALVGLLPTTFTGNHTRAEEVAHWTRERELGNGRAAAVLAAFAAIAKASAEAA